MAAFTTMAMIGLAAGAGMFAGKKLAPKPTQAAAGTTGTGAAAPTPPLSASESTSNNTLLAMAAQLKKRRRTTNSGVAAPRASTPGQSLIGGTSAPKSLLGY